ncbi:oxygen-independent coproporphyrinogen-3 oxidase [Tranquillimonas rosea]|uniref:Coproporphyrinogen-III oxidase n=2 Tax=Tranquillimonas rosea TaxID=641238 RepID=A0A1H9Q122_9RHOB|nr:oxygen-independent coproporphyrinogen-3 oxidase [Tranquillimonas rosea]
MPPRRSIANLRPMTTASRNTTLLDARVPRYTSYPPANRFTDAVGAETAADWMAAISPDARVSLYAHIPFCRRLCWFCACRTQGTRSDAPLHRYLDHLEDELALVRGLLPEGVRADAIHLGGGTPTILPGELLSRLGNGLREAVPPTEDAEISVEIDPCEIDAPRLDALAAMGLTRASIGVQDFDPVVQDAIGRHQGAEVTAATVEGLRARNVNSLNVDLLYGLPHQTVARLISTLERVLDLAPDRIALYGYAHVPWMARRQKLIPEAALPDGEARIVLNQTARELLTRNGYVPVGIDHYALPHDKMAVAARTGKLRRNFQGYTTDRADTLIGLGASAISRFPGGYAQNAPATGAWQERIAARRLATTRGYVLTDEDRACGAIIERLMCDGVADIPALCAAEGVSPVPYLHRARRAISELPDIASLEDGRLAVTSFAYVRIVAARIDGLSMSGKGRYSMAS